MPPKYSEEITSLFKARPKLKFIDPIPRPTPIKFSSISSFLPYISKEDFQKSGEIYLPINEARIERRKKRIQQNNERLANEKIKFNPLNNENATSNPYNTIIISGLNDEIGEYQLKQELTSFGRIKQIKFVYDQKTHKRRSYCFAEYENEESFNNAMRNGPNIRINGQNLTVDCERGRTVENWLPRRLGGGKGGESRSFKKKAIIIDAEKAVKPKKYAYANGYKYRGTSQEISKPREKRIGFEKMPNRRFSKR